MALFVTLRWVQFLRSGDALRPPPHISVRILRPHSTRKCSTHLPAIPHAAPIAPFPWNLSWVPSSSSPGRFLYSFFFFCNFPLSSTFPSGPSITSDFIASSNCFSEVQVQYYSGILWNNFLSCCNPVHLVLLPLLISSIVHCFSFWCVNTEAEALHFGLSAKQIGECCLQ